MLVLWVRVRVRVWVGLIGLNFEEMRWKLKLEVKVRVKRVGVVCCIVRGKGGEISNFTLVNSL